ncbi:MULTISPECIES: FadR/GntR family transcriptional regulator [Rhodococcus]|jgi:DNA-binding FadR family transcriptional regulator|uniref:FCD domain-containing protein n=2 Tax=Rhodococcus aetherivorans TaxID=191292 RepID=A0AA46NZ14_9NOCA|nr:MULTISPECIES: FCD domain-containing protein [Rhodococcus]ETT24915.1 GntR domain protein [Rhodococcus rhodochrous ATCC 21198]NCL73425.1 Glc operon transcriptional activator [Rhodococcus sp. YH1]KDE11003.1 GntR family transcriptional regulator [Rhodococcus aetherivorans]MDV6292871.1 FCD domain-containing protein [Rhodococcus aetherivorans]UGQ41752.1 FCD domain-containing protein [Rhodococcus aetherivorans]
MITGRAPKAAMVVAQHIIRDATRQNLAAGDLLPSERVMLEKYEIGRGTLREALRLLEFQGVIALKPGPRGGPVILDPDASHLASSLILLMQLKDAPFSVIIEARTALEPMISRLAAQRISGETLVELKETIDRMHGSLGDQHEFLEANKNFHDLIAWSSGNPLFGYMVDSLLGIMDGTAIGIDYPPHRREAIIVAHTQIYESLSQGDPIGSEERMRDHINAYRRYAQRKYPDLLEQVIQWDRALG